MDKETKSKILVGTALKQLKKAKISGQLDLKILYLFNVINELHGICEITKTYDNIKCLEKLMRDLQNKYPEICIYRKRNFKDKKFIK